MIDVINVRPLSPVHVAGDPATSIARFEEYEWRDMIELVRWYGFDPPGVEQAYYPQAYDQPVVIDAETSHELWQVISAAYNDGATPRSGPLVIGKLRVRQLVECAQIGAEQGGLEIRLVREEV